MHIGVCLSGIDHDRYTRSQVREKALELSRRFHLDSVEMVIEGIGRRFAPYPWEWQEEEFREVKAFLSQFSHSGVHLPFFGMNVICVNERVREEAMDQMRLAIEVAKRLEVDYAVVHATGTTEGLMTDREPQRQYKAFTRMLEWCKDSQLVLSIENAQNLHRIEDCAAMVRRLKNEDGFPAAMTFDTGHANHPKDGKSIPFKPFGTISGALEHCFDIINNIHLHNNDGTADQHRGLWDGSADLKECIGRLVDLGFQGSISLEVRPQPMELDREIETLLEWVG
ncbi:MAG: sugar phosphate isomerase/epimerase family protein [Thermodesulfobacteriota bacterium]